MDTLFLSPELQQYIPADNPFDYIMALEGETFRHKDGRHTFRMQLGERYYFVKLHHGVGVREIFKELLSVKWPIVSASNEYQAIAYLQRLGIATMTAVAFGKRGWNPARIESFVVTKEIADTYTLKDVTDQWLDSAAPFRSKLTLVRELSRIARQMHEAGMNHRDFYLCHFRIDQQQATRLADKTPTLYLMDLHRAQIRQKVPMRWRVKDIGALYFSAAHLPICRGDLLRFIRYYSGKPLRQTLLEDRDFWEKVQRRAQKFYRREWKQEMPLLLPGTD